MWYAFGVVYTVHIAVWFCLVWYGIARVWFCIVLFCMGMVWYGIQTLQGYCMGMFSYGCVMHGYGFGMVLLWYTMVIGHTNDPPVMTQ